MGVSFLTPLFLAGALAVAIPVIVHLIRHHRGEPLRFPSLMFVRRLPLESVRRRRIRDWPLLVLRVGALALLVLAFARPVIRAGEAEEGADGDAFREVVIVLDRSWSMARGERWDRARAAAGSVLDGLVSPDRVSLVVFDAGARIAVEPTLAPGQLRTVLDTLGPGWGSTRIGVGLQAASGILEASDRRGREVVLISDLQRRGWEDGPRDPLPAGTRLTIEDVGDDGIGAMVVADVTFQHVFLEGRQRVHPVVRVVRRGEGSPRSARAVLEIDGREVEAREVRFDGEGATAVPFEPFVLPEEGLRGAVRLEPVGAAAEEPFRFVLSPREILSVLLLDGTGGGEGLHLRSALSIAGGGPVRVETRTGARFSESDLRAAGVVVAHDVALPAGEAGRLLRGYVESGGGLLVVAGARSSPAGWEAAWDSVLPGRPAGPVERDPARGASLARVERDHPIFLPFTGLAGSFAAPRFYRYRSVTVEPDSADALGAGVILARFDDGAPALLERQTGSGRVLLWTSSLDTGWTDLPLHPVFVPIVREMVRYAGARGDAANIFTVGQPLDARFLLERAGLLPPGASAAESAAGLLVDPEGRGIDVRIGEGEGRAEQPVPGFYELRTDDATGRVAWTFAVNPDPGEADPARVDPSELALAVAPRGDADPTPEVDRAGTAGTLLAEVDGGASRLEERERRQSAWRFLVLGALLLLVSETIVANRGRLLTERG